MLPQLRAAAALLLAIPAIGCDLVTLGPSPLVPGSQWQVASLDGEPIQTELILTFIGESVTLSSGCGASSGEVVRETDGRAISLGPLQGPAGEPTCPDAAAESHRRVSEALEGVERWDVAGSDTELRGGEHVILLRPQRTDT